MNIVQKWTLQKVVIKILQGRVATLHTTLCELTTKFQLYISYSAKNYKSWFIVDKFRII